MEFFEELISDLTVKGKNKERSNLRRILTAIGRVKMIRRWTRKRRIKRIRTNRRKPAKKRKLRWIKAPRMGKSNGEQTEAG